MNLKRVLEESREFTEFLVRAGAENNAANVLKCIEFARQTMLDGDCSPEAYIYAKFVLIQNVPCASQLEN